MTRRDSVTRRDALCVSARGRVASAPGLSSDSVGIPGRTSARAGPCARAPASLPAERHRDPRAGPSARGQTRATRAEPLRRPESASKRLPARRPVSVLPRAGSSQSVDTSPRAATLTRAGPRLPDSRAPDSRACLVTREARAGPSRRVASLPRSQRDTEPREARAGPMARAPDSRAARHAETPSPWRHPDALSVGRAGRLADRARRGANRTHATYDPMRPIATVGARAGCKIMYHFSSNSDEKSKENIFGGPCSSASSRTYIFDFVRDVRRRHDDHDRLTRSSLNTSRRCT